ncbi:unnamed protein product, partial [Mesorhabditis belari]|uniref:Uncharacterized protein n=1 Tax=Mesorhabditis belari TaxID=2138241 RepID=A0AAF3J3B3_9BILA
MTFETSLECIRNGSIWDPNLDKYRMLRGRVHAKTATLWIGIGQLLLVTLYYIALLSFYVKFELEDSSDERSFRAWTFRLLKAQLIAVSIHALFLVLLIHVARTGTMADCLLLFVISTSSMVVNIFEQIALNGALFWQQSSHSLALYKSIILMCCLVPILFGLLTVCTYYRYLCDKQIFGEISLQLEALYQEVQHVETPSQADPAFDGKEEATSYCYI